MDDSHHRRCRLGAGSIIRINSAQPTWVPSRRAGARRCGQSVTVALGAARGPPVAAEDCAEHVCNPSVLLRRRIGSADRRAGTGAASGRSHSKTELKVARVRAGGINASPYDSFGR
jgi:hypothetical protein